MGFKETELINEIKQLTKFGEQLKECSEIAETQLREIDNTLSAQLDAYLTFLKNELVNLQASIKDEKKYKHQLELNTYNKKVKELDTKHETLVSETLTDLEDILAELKQVEEESTSLTTLLETTMGLSSYNALKTVFEKRLGYELKVETAEDIEELVSEFTNLNSYFQSINPVNPETSLNKALTLLAKPYIYTRNLATDNDTRRLIDLIAINFILYLIINFPLPAVSIIVTYVISGFITQYIYNSYIYSKFESFYLVTNSLNNLPNRYKEMILQENTQKHKEQTEKKKARMKEILNKRLDKLKIEENNELETIEKEYDLLAKYNVKKQELKTNSLLQKERVTTDLENKTSMLHRNVEIQTGKINKLKEEAIKIPWYTPIYNGEPKLGKEINHIKGTPEAIIGYKHNTEYNFDIVHTIPLKNTSYLIVGTKENLGTLNDTILTNIINIFNYYRPKLTKATLIDTVSLGRNISSLTINQDYVATITNQTAYEQFAETTESDIEDRNRKISKIAHNIFDYNFLMEERNGILLPYKYLYFYDIPSIETNEFLKKCAIQEDIGLTTIALYEKPFFKQESEVEQYEKFKSNFHFVINCTEEVITIKDNKLNSETSILEY